MILRMQIGELGRRAGLAAKTIRYYEEIGLLEEPARSANGYRDFGDEAVDRLRFIRDAQGTGLSLSEIASLLEMRDHGEQTCGHVIELLERHLADIDRQVRQLRSTRELLEGLTVRARSLDPSDCVDPNRCQTIGADSAVPSGVRRATRHAYGSPTAHTHG
jgi:DNA-binding transcriptional MerR regulator